MAHRRPAALIFRPARLRHARETADQIFLAGPPLVKAAIGEDASDEELGGADSMPRQPASGEYLARDDAQAMAIARELIAKLTWDRVPRRENAAAPKYDAGGALGIVPVPSANLMMSARSSRGWSMARISSISSAIYGAETVCGYAAIDGFEVGVLGNNGPIQPDGSTKAAQFIQLCDQAGCRSSSFRTRRAIWLAARPSARAR